LYASKLSKYGQPSLRNYPIHTRSAAADPLGTNTSPTARERLRRLADEDQEFWERLKAAYKDGLDAVDADGNPDFRARVMTAGAFLAEAYGRPPQAIVGDDEKPLRFVLESAFARGSDEPAD
jgi:hypothetical protein